MRAYWRAALGSELLAVATEERQARENIASFDATRFREGAVAEVAAIRTRLEADRARIARERMVDSLTKASVEAKQLVADWHEALKAFPAGYDTLVLKVSESDGDVELHAEIMLDLIESRSNLKSEDREALKAIIKTNDRLKQLPLFSAAHVAGAWALLAKNTTDVDEAARLQLEAGRWVRNRYA